MVYLMAATVKQINLYDRVKKLLVSYELSDCTFSVANQKFKAHKLILGVTSPVFEAMFYGPLATDGDGDIEVPDIQPEIFQLILNYIYTDKVEISGVENAFDLLYASRKYLLEHLSEMCVTYIQNNISVDNVVEILNYPDYLQDKKLVSYSLNLFCQHASFILQEKKESISYHCMKAFLECDHMNISEKDLIKHVFEWTLYCCEQNEILDMFENRREVLKKYGLLKLLRFQALKLSELEEIVANVNNLLLPNEYESIKENLRSGNTSHDVLDSIAMINIPRNSLNLNWHFCIRSPVRSVPPMIIDSNNFAIHCRVKAKTSVFIKSLCIPTRMAPPVLYRTNNVKIYVEEFVLSITRELNDKDNLRQNINKTVEFDTLVDIQLAEPFFIKRHEWYKISFVWAYNKPNPNSYLVEFRETHYTGHNVTFEFDDLPIKSGSRRHVCAGSSGSFVSGFKFCL
ncbi:BTB/POZ domain-containing protein 6-A-like isoform X2 [Spodoptera litura]|nr:BTB/POZ domain-containing protein 6-A-like isoform X2 [Spodoptera litura]